MSFLESLFSIPEAFMIVVLAIIIFSGGCVALLINLVFILFRVIINYFFPSLHPPAEGERLKKFIVQNLDKTNEIYCRHKNDDLNAD